MARGGRTARPRRPAFPDMSWLGGNLNAVGLAITPIEAPVQERGWTFDPTHHGTVQGPMGRMAFFIRNGGMMRRSI